MARAASLTITNSLMSGNNHRGSSITFTNIEQLNDQSPWSVPAKNSVLNEGHSVNFAQGNGLPILPPVVNGLNIFFTYRYEQHNRTYFQYGQIYLKIPAVGEHILWGHTNPIPPDNPTPPTPIPAFTFTISNNGGGNDYQVDISFGD